MFGRLAQRFVTAIERPALGYAAGLGAVALAALARATAGLVLPEPPNFMAFYPAVLFATLVSGLRGGVLAAFASAAVIWVFWAPKDPQAPTFGALHIQLLLFVITASAMALIAKTLRVAVRRGADVEAKFRIFQEQALDAFVIAEPVRRDGVVVDFAWAYANPAAERMAPRGVSGLTGRRVTEVYPPDIAQATIARLNQALASGAPDELESRRVVAGRERWIRSSAVPFGEGLAISFRDVTLQRESEQAAVRGRDQFRSIANAAPVLIWMSGPDQRASWFNESWLAFTGRTLEEELGRGWLENVHPDDRAPLLEAYGRHVAKREPGRMEYRIQRHDGEYRWIEESAAPAFDSHGAFQGYVGSCLDITDRRMAEAALEARVAERTRQLEQSLAERAKAEAALAQAQRLETVGRLTGGVAHDFNNLLTVVIGGLDMILRRPGEAERVKRLAEAALGAAQRGERLTRQLLVFSRRQELKLEVVDLSGLLGEIEPLVRRAVGEAVTLTVRGDGALGLSRLDPAQFEAAVLNLVVNAVDAIGDARGAIEISTARQTLAENEVAGAAAGDHIVVAVSDTGAGMSPETVEKAFEPFFTTKEVGKGTGLGLAQVYGFISQVGGAVAIESALGEGTTVRLYLPAAPDGAVATGEPEPERAQPGAARGVRVLLVEDDEAVRTVTEGLLAEMGCEVETAEDGSTALKRLQAGGVFDLILTDVAMPGGMSGPELAQAARAMHPDLPILLTSGYAGERLDAGAHAGGWPMLRKPFRAEALSAAVRDVLGR